MAKFERYLLVCIFVMWLLFPPVRVSGAFYAFDVRPSYAFSSFLDDVLSERLSMKDARYTHFGTSLHLKYGFSFTPASEVGCLYPGVAQGVGAGVNIFDYSKSIGTPVSLYLFQTAPIVNFNDRLSLDYEWNFGASMGWKPCDGRTASSNLIVGSRMNAYINLGLGVNWKLTPDYSLIAGLDLTHFSDGNTSFPNPGVNLLGLRVGVSRTFGKRVEGTPFRSDSTFRHHLLSYDLTGYGAWRKRVYRGGETPVLLDGHYAVAGLSFAPMCDIKRYFRAGVSADFQWDQSTDLRHYHISGDTSEDIRFSRPPFFSQVSVGIAARAELVMPIFSVNVGIGYNFMGPEESRATYQMANLKIYLTRSLYLNVGYQLQNFQRQSNLMLGVGYTFHNSYSKIPVVNNY
ncbi:MAG: acyloxyacyl hydrolase [Muribaculaceae bacterium]|nr:acyloxyacyl hydrolase [Muribaculaceae bacterium]